MPAVSYLRVSDRHQVTGDGFDRQRDTIERWRRSKDPEPRILQEFVEKGHTGTDFERPALSQLLEYCRKWHEIRTAEPGTAIAVDDVDDPMVTLAVGCQLTVVVERPDRLARDLIVSELLLDDFRKLGVKVVSAEADYDLTQDDDPTRTLVRRIMSAISDYEKSSIVTKLRKARERKKAKTGRCEGQKPFGHYEDEKAALAYILDGAGDGASAGQIAAEMNRRIAAGEVELRPRRGSTWNRGTVHKIIKANQAT